MQGTVGVLATPTLHRMDFLVSMPLPLAYWCVLIAALLPFVWVGFAKAGAHYRNKTPRDLSQYEGYRRRAHDAHQNAFEALPFFIGAVVLAIQFGGASGLTLNLLAAVWVLLRIGHGAADLADKATLRSVIWVLALVVNLAIFLLPALT